MIATEAEHKSCLATLYFEDSVEALQTFETEQKTLFLTGKSENLSFGARFINSAEFTYTLYEKDNESTISAGIY